jgi:hypothetical protein
MASADPLIDLTGARNLRAAPPLTQPHIVHDAPPVDGVLSTASFHPVGEPDAGLFRLWDELHAVSGGPSTFSQSRPFAEMSASLNKGAAYELFCWRDNKEGLAPTLMPLRRGDIDVGFSLWNRRVATVRLRGITILGTEPLGPDGPQRCAEAAAALLASDRSAPCFEFGEVAKDSALWRRLNASDVLSRFHLQVVDGFRQWQSCAVPSSMEEYGNRLGKKKRYNLQRQERLLQSKLTDPLQLVKVDSPEALDSIFGALEKFSAFPDVPRTTVRNYYSLSASHRLMKSYVLRAGDRPIGVCLASFDRETLFVHSLHHDTGLMAYSPGTALWQRVLRRLIEEREITRVVFGFGETGHRHSANTVELRGRVILTRKGTAQRALLAPYMVLSKLKRISKQLRA